MGTWYLDPNGSRILSKVHPLQPGARAPGEMDLALGHFHYKLLNGFLCGHEAHVRTTALPAQTCSVNNLLLGKWEQNEPGGIFCVNFGVPLTAICVICPGRP